MNRPPLIARVTALWLVLLAPLAAGAHSPMREGAPHRPPAVVGNAHAGRAPGYVAADRRRGHREPAGGVASARSGISLDQAVAMVEKRFNARVVRTEVRGSGDHKVYVLRLLNEAGRVWTVRVDAATGAIR